MKDFKPSILIIDYADIMRSTRTYDSLRHELKLVYEELRNLAMEMNIPIWTASQANRDSAKAEVVGLENMSEAKLISYTLNDFSTEIEMESFLHFMEKHGDEMYKKLKKYGLLRWRVNQVWNKGGGFALSSIFEYKDEKAFEKSVEEIKNFQKKHEDYFNKINIKRTSSRSINMLDFNY